MVGEAVVVVMGAEDVRTDAVVSEASVLGHSSWVVPILLYSGVGSTDQILSFEAMSTEV
jgi:hypothetical protein